MRGVVIWYSRAEFRAVIWCEDSKELGIASGATAWRNPMRSVEVGDFVSFQVQSSGRDRKCRDIHVIEAQAAPALTASICAMQGRKTEVSRNPLLHLCASRD